MLLQDYWSLFKDDSPNWENYYSLKCFGKQSCHAGGKWELQDGEESYW